jgi:hypothetical protein
MVGHDIQQQSHPSIQQPVPQGFKVFFGSYFGIDMRWVGDIVTVPAAMAAYQQRRCVQIGDPQRRQVIQQP